MNIPYLIGKNVYLRPLERSDAPSIVPWFNDPEVTRFMLRYQPMSVRQEEEWIDNIGRSEHDLALGIAVKSDDRLIGVAGLKGTDFRNRFTTFGITIGVKEEWSKGYGTEATGLIVRHAFETLNLHRIELQVFEYNVRGIRAYEKVGFQREGVLRQSCFREGRYWDTIVMGILRDDWEGMESATL